MRLRLLACLPVALILAAAPVHAAAPAPAAAPATATAQAQAAKPPAETLTPAQAQQALAVLQDDAKRTQLLQVLKAVAVAAPAPATPAAVVAANGLGGEIMRGLSAEAATAATQVSATMTAAANFPLLWDWLVGTFRSPTARDALFQATWRLALVIAIGIAAHYAVFRLSRRPAGALEITAQRYAPPTLGEGQGGGGQEEDAAGDTAAELPEAPKHVRRTALMRRVPLGIGRLLLSLAGPAVFAIVTYVLLGLVTDDADTREVIIAVIDAYLLAALILCVAWTMVAPDSASLRLLPMRDEDAATTMRWLRRIVLVATLGPALVTTAQILGLYLDAAEALNKLLGLVFALLLIMLVLRIRTVVARAIGVRRSATGFVPLLRRRLAAMWHLMAMLLIAAAWVVWAFEVNHGFAVILRLFLSTAIVAALARVISIFGNGAIDRVAQMGATPWLAPSLDRRIARYSALLRVVLNTAIAVASLVTLLQAWGLDLIGWYDSSRLGSQLLSTIWSIVALVLVAWVLWEVGNALLDGKVEHLEAQAQIARAARWRTLVPILRTVMLVSMLALLVLTILSEIGVNTAPLLAGASIFGVALGFGSQKLVQDFITGLFLLLENAMQVGDSVTVSGLSGTVEHLTIRTLRLRAGDGSVHIIPFSAVTSVTNVNRGIGNATVTITVAAHEDTDRVSVILKEIGAELREDESYGPMILGDLALWGIDKVDGSGITIDGQIACTDTGRWGVQREYNRRMKRRLQDEGIDLAVPVQTIVVQREREAPARSSTPPGAAPVAAAPKIVSPPPEAQGHAA